MTSLVLLRRQMVEIGRRLQQQNLIVAAEGNLSVRLGGHAFLITPSGVGRATCGSRTCWRSMPRAAARVGAHPVNGPFTAASTRTARTSGRSATRIHPGPRPSPPQGATSTAPC
ncbi:MAG: class II aldolase/adducin family protein [bacterium]|nr:class II aldolase/adducin family protein [bacterium]